MELKVLVSAGEASGDLYASLLVEELRRMRPDTRFFGCTGPRLRAAGVETVVDAASLAVVGLLEVVTHIPRIWGEYRKLVRRTRELRPDVAILTDSPDFHLPVARRLHAAGVPVIYLVAPQAWAWRKGRVNGMRRTIAHLLCIFPFEEEFFRREGVRTTYVGHPLAGLAKPSLTRGEFFRKHRLAPDRQTIAVLPGSRRGEAARHLPALLDAVEELYGEQAINVVLPASAHTGAAFFRERIGGAPVSVIEGESWDAIAHADLALAASGTVTVEAALLGTLMVTFYKVSRPSWVAGKLLVGVPFYSMVNLIAGRAVVPELMQSRMTGEAIAREARRLLAEGTARAEMKLGLAEVAEKLRAAPRSECGAGAFACQPRESVRPMQSAAAIVLEVLEGQVAHVL